MCMKKTNYLNKIFTIPYLDSIQHSKHFQSILSDKNISSTTYKSVIASLYQELDEHHRNEYFYGYFLKKYRNKWNILGDFLDTEVIIQKRELNDDNQRLQIDESLL